MFNKRKWGGCTSISNGKHHITALKGQAAAAAAAASDGSGRIGERGGGRNESFLSRQDVKKYKSADAGRLRPTDRIFRSTSGADARLLFPPSFRYFDAH